MDMSGNSQKIFFKESKFKKLQRGGGADQRLRTEIVFRLNDRC